MGKKCFAPRCNARYKSCTEKLSLFSAPRDEERLRVWRNAIPRKDQILQSTDHLCERHFEPHLVSKTWEKVYNGNVLCRAPRKASLSKDAVPSIFPDCSSYLSKEKKQRKRPAERLESYAVMEPVMRHEALDQLRERLGTLVPIFSSLPLLSTEQLQKQRFEMITYIVFPPGLSNPTEKLKQLSCEFCCRKVGTWLYASPKELVSEDTGCKQENGDGHGVKRKHEEVTTCSARFGFG
ncbi:hypothetical protein HPB51_005426 [Rhipicephalus microplus]|uniref:THAP-type domain-containing protein n=1 Tax=Rhipicephalus microplus TaxID=6941 RepID=A0A9J6DTF3_RHIMP|nr:hypothetical protein HPB51_005426 [Rhipicephalus microplus]